jgi:hypothetical protein
MGSRDFKFNFLTGFMSDLPIAQYFDGSTQLIVKPCAYGEALQGNVLDLLFIFWKGALRSFPKDKQQI